MVPSVAARQRLYQPPSRAAIVSIRTYKDLEVWRGGIELAVRAYECTDGFPRYERFGISSQMYRAAVSIPANIAEGQCKSRKEFIHHGTHSRGSLQELMTLLLIAERRRYGAAEQRDRVLHRAELEGDYLAD